MSGNPYEVFIDADEAAPPNFYQTLLGAIAVPIAFGVGGMLATVIGFAIVILPGAALHGLVPGSRGEWLA